MISFREPPPGSRNPAGNDLPSRLYKQLQLELTPHEFETWFQGTPCTFRSPDLFILTVRNNFQQAWMERKYSQPLLSAACAISDFKPRIIIKNASCRSPDPRMGLVLHEDDPLPTVGPAAPSVMGGAHATFQPTPGPSQQIPAPHTFENFVVGKGSNVAHAAALAVSENPGASYNPLYIYGDTGLGKTHLVHAIYLHLAATARLRQVYVTADAFTNDFTAAAVGRNLEDFRRRYRCTDVLILDDMQYLSTKPKTQDEFLHTIESLLASNSQVVITSNCAADDLKVLTDRLNSCLDGALAARVTTPDFETRIRALHQIARLRNIEISPRVAGFVARKACTNIRELEGILKYLVNLASLYGCPPSVEMAAEAVSAIITEAEPHPVAITVHSILQVIEDYYDVKQKELLSSSKVRSVVYARQAGMYLARELTPLSLEQIGLHFGGKDHTTVLYALKTVGDNKKKNPNLRAELEILRSRLTQSRNI